MGLPLRQGEGTAAASAVNRQKIQGLLVVHECCKMQSCQQATYIWQQHHAMPYLQALMMPHVVLLTA